MASANDQTHAVYAAYYDDASKRVPEMGTKCMTVCPACQLAAQKAFLRTRLRVYNAQQANKPWRMVVESIED